MGHIRLGRLYKSRKWNQVIDLLESDTNAPQLAGATLSATEKQLRLLNFDPAVSHAFWLLVRITWAARTNEFRPFLADLGINLSENASVFSLMSSISDHLQQNAAQHTESGVFAGIAGLSFADTISGTVAEESRSLFGSNTEDIQNAFKTYSSQKQFGIISRKFFGHFLSRTLEYFINKELSNCIGANHSLQTIQSAREFNEALSVYSYQSAKILEDFAGGWYSKHNWEEQGQITEEDASNFVAFALRKLRMELGQEYNRELH